MSKEKAIRFKRSLSTQKSTGKKIPLDGVGNPTNQKISSPFNKTFQPNTNYSSHEPTNCFARKIEQTYRSAQGFSTNNTGRGGPFFPQ